MTLIITTQGLDYYYLTLEIPLADFAIIYFLYSDDDIMIIYMHYNYASYFTLRNTLAEIHRSKIVFCKACQIYRKCRLISYRVPLQIWDQPLCLLIMQITSPWASRYTIISWLLLSLSFLDLHDIFLFLYINTSCIYSRQCCNVCTLAIGISG